MTRAPTTLPGRRQELKMCPSRVERTQALSPLRARVAVVPRTRRRYRPHDLVCGHHDRREPGVDPRTPSIVRGRRARTRDGSRRAPESAVRTAPPGPGPGHHRLLRRYTTSPPVPRGQAAMPGRSPTARHWNNRNRNRPAAVGTLLWTRLRISSNRQFKAGVLPRHDEPANEEPPINSGFVIPTSVRSQGIGHTRYRPSPA